jgi:hypothetical protein
VPLAPSRFLNDSPDVAHVGSQACADCHEAEHQSYLLTAHSRALEAVRLAEEPPDASFRHDRSNRMFHSARVSGQFVHRQQRLSSAGDVLLAEERPLKYAIGSGHHSRSYLAEIDGFLVESPLTWYAARQGWEMSPGYDRPEHLGFERQADHGCLVCHAGHAEKVAGNRDRVTLHELAIGCESCHGAGALHVARRSGAKPAVDHSGPAGDQAADLTIVHPDRLSRAERDALCAGCHLRGAATVTLRGRTLDDLRPGRKLEEVRLDYIAGPSTDKMTVVGHMEQMRTSACYQRSDSLTCISCHDPHAPPTAAERVGYYREKCNECHHEQCGLPRDVRLQRNADDNCVTCHMPQRPTDLPHFAFTHHRIGLHSEENPPGQQEATAATLVPLFDEQVLSPPDRERCLGLAYLEISDKQPTGALRNECLGRAEQLLTSARQQGAGDVEVLAALARLAWERGDWRRGRELAALTLAEDDRGSGARTTALVVEANSAFELRDHPAAIVALEELTKLRRRSDDWVLLGRALGASGRLEEAAVALAKAADIQPFRAETRLLLAGTYERLERVAQAKQQRTVAEALAREQH